MLDLRGFAPMPTASLEPLDDLELTDLCAAMTEG